jgi:hypothetical protein
MHHSEVSTSEVVNVIAEVEDRSSHLDMAEDLEMQSFLLRVTCNMTEFVYFFISHIYFLFLFRFWELFGTSEYNNVILYPLK